MTRRIQRRQGRYDPLVLVIRDRRNAKLDYVLTRSEAEHLFWIGKLKLTDAGAGTSLQYTEVNP